MAFIGIGLSPISEAHRWNGDVQSLIGILQESDLVDGGAGVRAQACDRKGGLLDDFAIIETDTAINVCNAPSPAATSSLSIGKTVSELALKRFD